MTPPSFVGANASILMSAAWNEQLWVQVLVVMIPAVAGFFTLLYVLQVGKRNRYDILKELSQEMTLRKAPKGSKRTVYDLAARFMGCAGLGNSYMMSLVDRVRIVHGLTPRQRGADMKIVKHYVDVLNRVAESMEYRFVEHRQILAKFHTALVRESFLVEPYIVYRNIYTATDRWGRRVLILGDIARRYNDMNSIHRNPVFLLKGGFGSENTEYGVIHPAPAGLRFEVLRPWWWFRSLCRWYPTISKRRKRRQKNVLKEVKSLVGG